MSKVRFALILKLVLTVPISQWPQMYHFILVYPMLVISSYLSPCEYLNDLKKLIADVPKQVISVINHFHLKWVVSETIHFRKSLFLNWFIMKDILLDDIEIKLWLDWNIDMVSYNGYSLLFYSFLGSLACAVACVMRV